MSESAMINLLLRGVLRTSGRATGGRELHGLRQRRTDPRTTVLLVGHQAVSTRGQRRRNGEETLRIVGEEICGAPQPAVASANRGWPAAVPEDRDRVGLERLERI